MGSWMKRRREKERSNVTPVVPIHNNDPYIYIVQGQESSPITLNQVSKRNLPSRKPA